MEFFLACFYCEKIENSINSLISHVRSEGILPYKCKAAKCSKAIFGNVETFRSHIKKHFETTTASKIQLNFNNFEDNFVEVEDCIELSTPSGKSDIQRRLSSLRFKFLKVLLPLYSNEKVLLVNMQSKTLRLCVSISKIR